MLWSVVFAGLAQAALFASSATAQTCGPPCQKCAAEHGVPRDASGVPLKGSTGRGFQLCVERVRAEMQGGGRTAPQPRR